MWKVSQQHHKKSALHLFYDSPHIYFGFGKNGIEYLSCIVVAVMLYLALVRLKLTCLRYIYFFDVIVLEHRCKQAFFLNDVSNLRPAPDRHIIFSGKLKQIKCVRMSFFLLTGFALSFWQKIFSPLPLTNITKHSFSSPSVNMNKCIYFCCCHDFPWKLLIWNALKKYIA